MVPFALRLRAPLAAFMQQGIGTAAPVLSSGFAACGARLRSRPRRGSCGLRFFVNALSKKFWLTLFRLSGIIYLVFTIFVRLHNFFPLFCACLTRAGGSVLPPATSADSQIFVRGLTKFSHAWQYPFALKYRKGTDRLAGAFAILRVAG